MIRGLCKIFCALTMFIMSMTIITTDLLGMRLNQSQQNTGNAFVIVLPTKLALHPNMLLSMLSAMCDIHNYPLDPLSFQSEEVRKQLEYCGILSLFDYDSFIVYADSGVSEYLRDNGLSVVNRKLKTLFNDPQNPFYGDVELSRLNDSAIQSIISSYFEDKTNKDSKSILLFFPCVLTAQGRSRETQEFDDEGLGLKVDIGFRPNMRATDITEEYLGKITIPTGLENNVRDIVVRQTERCLEMSLSESNSGLSNGFMVFFYGAHSIADTLGFMDCAKWLIKNYSADKVVDISVWENCNSLITRYIDDELSFIRKQPNLPLVLILPAGLTSIGGFAFAIDDANRNAIRTGKRLPIQLLRFLNEIEK